MWVNFSKIFFVICFSYLMLMTKYGICAEYDDSTKVIRLGYKLVENFYSCLTSDSKQDFCSKIFTTTSYLPKNEVDMIWKYSKKNKQLFVWKTNAINEADTFKWARKTISYYNPRNLDRICDGYLYISLVHTLSDRFYSGIYKEIAFPIVKDETSGEYKIEFRNIKINGIIIDFENEFVRDFDIIENLGFNPSK